MNEFGHDRTTIVFRKASLDFQKERHAITNIEYTNAGIMLAEPLKLDDLYRTVESIYGSEPFRTMPVPTISTKAHEFLIKRGFEEYDQLWKELAGI